jgi:hypothetical protein
LGYERVSSNVIDQPADMQPAYLIRRTNPVHFGDGNIPVYANGLDAFDLPVLQGDTLVYTMLNGPGQ